MISSKPLRIGIIGVGGYAQMHFKTIDNCRAKSLCTLKAAVIRVPYEAGDAETESVLFKKGGAIYRDYRAMFAAEKGQLDLVTVPCGIDQHAEQSIAGLEAGYHVLCEKPAAGTVEEGLRMQAASLRSGKILAIGFQYIFSPSIRRIKALTLGKELGKLIKAKTYVIWPRNSLYYKRNNWAGKLQHNGRWIYDSPLQNATSHFLNNMLYVAGTAPERTAEITAVYGENYRAKPIESADTQYIRAESSDGVVIHQITTHAARQNVQPVTEYIYEQGKVVWRMEPNGKTAVYEKTAGNAYTLTAEFDDGAVPIQDLVFIDTIEAINKGQRPPCHIGNSLEHLRCVSGSFASSGGAAAVDPCYLEELPAETGVHPHNTLIPGESNIVIRGIEETIGAMHERETGFYGFNLAWAKESSTVKIRRDNP